MNPFGTCDSCGTPLLQPRGFYGTDLCGPCCVGEAATLGMRSWECAKRDCPGAEEVPAGQDYTDPCHICGAAMTLQSKIARDESEAP